MTLTNLQSLAAYLYAAPDWMDVVSIAVHEEGKPSVEIPLDQVELYPLPISAFQLSIVVRPPDHN